MKLQLNKLMAGLALAGSVVALVGCGGGDAPTLVINQDATLPEIKGSDSASVATARTIFTAASGASFTLPALTLAGVGNENKDVPASSVLEVTAKPSPTGNEIGNFKLVNGADSAEGTIEAGSCVFKVASSPVPTGIFANMAGKSYKQEPCQIKLGVANLPVGTAGPAVVSLVLGNTTVPSNKSIEVSVTQPTGSDNTVTIKVGDSTVVVDVPTGATVVR
jgi:hypothetical protein